MVIIPPKRHHTWPRQKCLFTPDQYALPHWKYVLRCCEIFSIIVIPRQESNGDETNMCHTIIIISTYSYHTLLCMLDVHMKKKQHVHCV